MGCRFMRAGVVGAFVVGATVVAPTAASAAADPRASCVGVIVSELAPAGDLDVNDFKAIADAVGAPNFGAFVAGGARQHLGSSAACLP